jgi:isoleucyl-tRNA synthetase
MAQPSEELEFQTTGPTRNSVGPRYDHAEVERRVRQLWREHDVARRCVIERQGSPEWVFYEGPPTANGRPGVHHVLARAFKDLFIRYKTMRGYHVLRKAGWDTHGLPVEIEVERKLELHDKREVERYGVAAFNQRCRESVWRYVREWEALTEHMAYWVDLEERYATLDNNYIESLWWILKQLWDRDLLYQGHDVVPYCPRCGTPLSSHEVSQGYQDTVDPSLYVRFPLQGEKQTYLLAWTTTPWTLTGNVALAVGGDIEYLQVRDERSDVLYLAADRTQVVLQPGWQVLERLPGSSLAGKHYDPPYRFVPTQSDYAYVVTADFVGTNEGTGIVHLAPAYGADDMRVARQHGLPVLQTVETDGTFAPEVTPWAGQFVKDADASIQEDLRQRGLLYKAETHEHSYPFCWRCDSPLLYYARQSWFIRTSAFRDRLVALNRQTDWRPAHIRDGRFGQWLENNVDWSLGRNRYWGTPLPLWRSDAPGSTHVECVGSVAELEAKVGRPLGDLDLHRPYVDRLTWPAPDGGTMRRVPEVADCWFDAGSMPIAQWHYPFENRELWARQQKADFVCEAVDQTRGWFYTLHALSTLLYDRVAFRNVICLGHVLDEQGRKMSKSRGNVIDPWQVFEQHGVDATRWHLYTACPPGNGRRFSVAMVGQVQGLMNTLWNTYSFYMTYARLSDTSTRVERFDPSQVGDPLDRWLLSELHRLVENVTAALEDHDVNGATRPVEAFVAQLSNWYVRLSRRRMWEDDPQALGTLYYCLVTLCHLLAPAMPYLAEAMYQNLVRSVDPEAPDSVHLSRWPQAEKAWIDEELSADMALVQQVTRLGHAARQSAGLKVRQPLAEVVVYSPHARESQSLVRLQPYLLQELNVKALTFAGSPGDLVQQDVHPLPQRLGPRLRDAFPALCAALKAMDQDSVAARLQAGETVEVVTKGQVHPVEAEDVEVRTRPRARYSVAKDGHLLVAVRTELTVELRREGQARDLVRQVQQLRKDAGLAVSDRIVAYLSDVPQVRSVLNLHGDTVRSETLIVDLHLLPAAAWLQATGSLRSTQFELGGHQVSIALEVWEG